MTYANVMVTSLAFIVLGGGTDGLGQTLLLCARSRSSYSRSPAAFNSRLKPSASPNQWGLQPAYPSQT
jgi:hypothetical protein